MQDSNNEYGWHHDAIIYQLHVKAFNDSNGDGYGDFRGLIEKLDYISALGVTAIWLLPFYPSPLKDDGYDIADYTAIHPSYGSLADFKDFLGAAHERGMRVITELVINHTSDQHAWFQRARAAPKGSPERDFYVWSDDPNKYANVRIIFSDTESSNWAWDPVAQQFYWHRFFTHQPDLNFDNPAVLEAVIGVMRFWLELGVDGLRLDAIPYLVEREGTSCESLPETHAILKKLRAALDAEFTDRVFLAEANQSPSEVSEFFGSGDECHMAFHFPVMPRMYMSLAREDSMPIIDIMGKTPPIPAGCQWAIFLRNHDELTLEMVTDDERAFMFEHYAKDKRMRVNVGIRRRLATLMDNSRDSTELMIALLMSLPGSPILYYGDEIGMGDNIYLGDRNSVRTPMQWNGDRNAGFSKSDGAALFFPVIADPPYDYRTVNVEAQERTSSSLLKWVRAIVFLRRQYHAFGRGTFEPITHGNRRVLAFIRRYENEVILCVSNLARHAQYVELDLGEFNDWAPMELWSGQAFPCVTRDKYLLTLTGREFMWFQLMPPGGPRRLGAISELGA